MLVAEVRPSTVCELYDSAKSGSGPKPGEGTLIGYDQENAPVCAETCQDADGANGVAAASPVPPAVPAVAASTVGDPSSVTVADNIERSVSLSVGSTVATVHFGLSGVVNAHAGSRTSRSRDPYPAPAPWANDE
ncbi:hypothetical protein Athai_35410 [Actinocatenispora thailandica]|uniref:Uncharacterized protein n=1 Tax=Actinocatenispora thailandica TaxID=227318 RepID=A0A7R7HYH2_9ACTN|nr:hypothetical protein Athai_35410 [Actinocatenispora thailandica]